MPNTLLTSYLLLRLTLVCWSAPDYLQFFPTWLPFQPSAPFHLQCHATTQASAHSLQHGMISKAWLVDGWDASGRRCTGARRRK